MDNTHLVAGTVQVTAVNNVEDGVTVVSVSGRWSNHLRYTAARQLKACIAETPHAIIVDLAQLSDPTGASLATWRDAGRSAATQAWGVDLILAAVPAPLLSRLQDTLVETTTTASVATAHARLEQPRWAHRRQIALSPDGISAARARMMAGDACLAWALPHLFISAMLIVSELTGNAIEHAGTDITVAVSLRGHLLHLAIQDHDYDLPRLIEAQTRMPGALIEQRGAGLRLIRSVAEAWGAIACQDGKVVWATLDIRTTPTWLDR
ncbi:hypothetical protein Apa02nite_085910 [Actinoplanes palleronii]|uniref:Uncharacterized protein n=1 Tax=Actinoplanes palleronii TaxID=113570 RepID=A0ABQ4BP79_9ACTN|nr:hypothetical protein Apa02nite_085910 [Actinoplanes palleronii]